MVALTAFALIIPALLWRAWGLRILWDWFIVPQFGLSSLSLVMALGLCLIAEYMFKPWRTKDNIETFEELFSAAFVAAFVPPFVVGIAWLILHVGG